MTKDIEGMTEKLFAVSIFDPSYMNAEYAKSLFHTALATLTDEEYEHIVELMEEKKMKYFEATAMTPYCGEELTGFYMAESEEKLRESGELDCLVEDCVAEYFDSDEYETYGFACPEDYEEYYYCDSDVKVREISKEEYDEAIAKGW